MKGFLIMNRIEEKMAQLKDAGKKAFITYTTAGHGVNFISVWKKTD